MKKRLQTLASWVVLMAMFIAIYSLLGGSKSHDASLSSAEDSSSHSGETWLAVLLVGLAALALIVVVVRRRAAAMGNVLALKKTTARLLTTKPATRFTDVGGAENAKEQLRDIVDFLKNPERWQKSGARLPRGALLEGPPGCGKTLLARALAGEAGASFFEVSATEFSALFIGVGASRVRDLFEEAAKKAPAIIFIDELDAVGGRRGRSVANLGHEEREHTLNQLLVCMDGFANKSRVVVVAATNRADILDPALLRPGRFDARIQFSELSVAERKEILQIHTRNKPVGASVDLQKLADLTPGFTGSELEHATNHAALMATRRARREKSDTCELRIADFMQAIDERAGREHRFDKLDALLIASNQQLSKPEGVLAIRATLSDDAHIEGEIVWIDAAFVKIRRPDGSGALVSKQQIRRFEAMPLPEVV